MDALSQQVRTYLGAWQAKDVGGIAAHLHEDVRFRGPMANLHGRDAVLAACERMFPLLESIDLQRLFVEGDEAVCLYDFKCPAPIGACRTVEHLTFEKGKITAIELYFDPRPFLGARS